MTDIVCLYEESGLSADDWALAGYDVYCYDIETKAKRVETRGAGRKIFMPWDARDYSQNIALLKRHMGKTVLVLAFPPCTDLAVSGAMHFASKRKADPDFQIKAVGLALTAYNIAKVLGVPYAIENPVSVLSTMWRKPDHIFDPWYYGGYLPEDDVHPLYPEYIAPRDAYPKKTCYWTGGGFIMPQIKPVHCPEGYSAQHKKLGGKSKKTKQIRSASPRGIARAIFETMRKETYNDR